MKKTETRRASAPKIYKKIDALAVYSDAKRTKEDKEKIIKEIGPEAFLKQEERTLYKMGFITIPRTLLKSSIYKDLKPAAKTIYLWLMVKKKVVEMKKNAGIEDEETRRYPAITAKNIEIETYTGVTAKNVWRSISDLQEAGLIKTKKEMIGGKITATLYQIPTWPHDKTGYIKVPLKSMITPAWIQMSHSAKALWLLMLSKDSFEKTMTPEKFPSFQLPYGVYLYSYALSVSDAKEEADFVIKQIKGRKIGVGVWFDMEDADKYKKKHNFTFSKSNISNICNAFCKKIQDAGYYAGIYASQSWLDSYIDCPHYDKWCASWGSNNGKRNNDMSKYGTLHQYTSKPLDKSVMYAPLSTYDMSKKKPATKPAADTKPAQSSTGTTTEKADIVVPSLTLKKSTQEVIDDAIAWAKWIAGDKRFGYGRMGGSKYLGTTAYSITHSGGCHFCGTNAKKISRAKAAKLPNPEEWEYTFVCNTLTHAAYAHAGVQSMLKNGNHSWWTSTYQKSKNWEEIKKPSKVTDLKPGDICASDTHFAMYIGNGKGIQATSRGDVRTGTTEWQKSISTFDFADFFKRSKHVFRYVGTVNAETPIRYGEVGKRVKQWQAVINRLNGKKLLAEDGLFGDETRKQTMHLQAVLKVDADGIVGKNTLTAAAKALKPAPAVDYEKIALEVIAGKWGNGDERKKKLEAAGYDYDKVQAKVNEILTPAAWVIKANSWAKKIAADNRYHYVTWTSKKPKTKKCPICDKHEPGEFFGWNCIGFSFAVWHHGGGLKCKCNCGVIDNGTGEKILKAKTDAEALKLAQDHIGLKDIKVIRNKNGIPKSQWRAGDICLKFDGDTYKHTYYYMGDGKVCDSSNYSDDKKDIAVRSYKNYTAKVIIRYTGK